MERLLVAGIIVVIVAVIASVVRSRQRTDAPTQQRYAAPQQLDRRDFPAPEAPWLVAVFTSATCDACALVVEKARVLETREVAVAAIEFSAGGSLHDKYAIEAVPTTVIADADGVTRAAFLGPMTATDLWAAVAEVREPGSSPEPHLGRSDVPGG